MSGERGITAQLLHDNATIIPFFVLGSAATSMFQLVMARFLEPENYAAAVAILGGLSLLVTPSQVIQTLIARRTAELLALGKIVTLRTNMRLYARRVGLISITLAISIAAASPILQSVLQLESPWPLVIAAIAAGTLTFEPVARGVLQGTRNFLGLGFTLASHGLGRIVVGGIAVAAFTGGPTGALLASPASAISGIIMGWVGVRRNLPKHNHHRPVDTPTSNLKSPEYVRVTIILLVVAGLLHLDVLVIKILFSPMEAAEYAALSLVGRMVFWGGTAIGTVLLPHIVWQATTGGNVIRTYIVSLLLMTIVVAATAFTILTWPAFTYATIFNDRYTANTDLLPLAVTAAGLLAIVAVTANLHIGAGHVRVWCGLAVIMVGTILGYAVAHETIRDVLSVLVTGTACAAIYVTAEAIALAQQQTSLQSPGQP